MNIKVYEWKLWSRRVFLIALIIPLIIFTILGLFRVAVCSTFIAALEASAVIVDVYKQLWRRKSTKLNPDELANEDFWGNC